MKMRIALTLALLVALSLSSARADVQLPAAISSHLVLQRDMRVPIWGTAAAGEQVSVQFRDQEKSATADAQGKWSLKLDPLTAGGPDKLVVTGRNTITIDDVLVGEVWVGSGQSNMQGAVAGYLKGDPVLASLAEGAPYTRLRLLKGNGPWAEATPEQVQRFSALLFAFGVQLQKELDVPVGLMLGAAGGTGSGYWLSEQALADDEACQRIAKEYDASADYQRLLAQYQSDLAKWQVIADKAKADGAKLPAALRKPLRGGERSGKIGNLYEAHIRPFVSFGIRGVLWDQGESGTAVTGVDQYALMGALIRGWRNEWGQGEFPFLYVQKPSGLGCVWDGSNPTPAPARKAAPLPGKVPTDGQDRETYVRIMTYPQTAMVTDSDLGSGTHPTNKSGYGERAGRVALGMAYGRKLEIYGPVYKSHVVEGNKIRVTFEHTGQGLAFQHGEKLQGFAIAGEDGAFEWATALIDGNSVIVSSAQVSKPVAVRYAWSTQIPWANLFNRDGLPALTFRTDSW